MAPTPTPAENGSPIDSSPSPTSSPSEKKEGRLSTATIVAASIFAFFLLCFTISTIAFLLHKRSERKKLPPSHRTSSYRPFRTNSSKTTTTTSDKSALLENGAPTPEAEESLGNDKERSMFSRSRGSSVSLFVAEDTSYRSPRQSMDTVNLIPLAATPVTQVPNPLERAYSDGSSSAGSGVRPSAGARSMSGRFSVVSTRGPSPLSVSASPVEGYEGRPRSTSSASTAAARYYDGGVSSPKVPSLPPVLPPVQYSSR